MNSKSLILVIMFLLSLGLLAAIFVLLPSEQDKPTPKTTANLSDNPQGGNSTVASNNGQLLTPPPISIEKLRRIYAALCVYVGDNSFVYMDKSVNRFAINPDVLSALVRQQKLSPADLIDEKGAPITIRSLQERRHNFSFEYLLVVAQERHSFGLYRKILDKLRENPELARENGFLKKIFSGFSAEELRDTTAAVKTVEQLVKQYPCFQENNLRRAAAEFRAVKIQQIAADYAKENKLEQLPDNILDKLVLDSKLPFEQTVDPWGRAYVITTKPASQDWIQDGKNVTREIWLVCAAGPDGIPGNRDDVDAPLEPTTDEKRFPFHCEYTLSE